MAEQAASQAEVWDDTALLDSWNETFEEYKVCYTCRNYSQQMV